MNKTEQRTPLRKFITCSIFGPPAEAVVEAHVSLDVMERDLEALAGKVETFETGLRAIASGECFCEPDPRKGEGPCESCVARNVLDQTGDADTAEAPDGTVDLAERRYEVVPGEADPVGHEKAE